MKITKQRRFVCPHQSCDSTELYAVREETTARRLFQCESGSDETNGWERGKEEVWDCEASLIECSNGHTLYFKDETPVHDDIEELERWFEEQGPVDDRGEPLPADLVLLPNPKDLDEADFEKVMGAAWWEIDGVLCASAEAIDYLSEDDPLDAGVDVGKAKSVCYIPNILHRGNEVDGFYHA
jgi:hypothetical protein